MPHPSPSLHVWTGRAARPTVAERGRALASRPRARLAASVLAPALAVAATLGAARATDPVRADDGVVVAAASPGTPGATAIGEPQHVEEAAEPRAAVPAGPLRFAAVDGVNLFVTSPAAKIVGFHEAAYPTALTMLPIGNGLVFDSGVGGRLDAPGPNYVVMGSRGRPTTSTSAVDIAQEPGSPVVSPVTGTVVDVRSYELYGRYPDTRIELVPAGRPDLRVVVLHVRGAAVAPGAQVEAGVTRIAETATHFPFTSHVDRYAGGHPPHVHVEVKRA